MKLFDIKPNEIQYVIKITTYKHNQVFNKILKALNPDKDYKIRELNKWKGNEKEYEVIGKIAGTLSDFVACFKSDLTVIMQDEFPSNYHFDLKNGFSLGYTFSFIIHETEKIQHFVAHRIIEVRGQGEKPKQIIKI